MNPLFAFGLGQLALLISLIVTSVRVTRLERQLARIRFGGEGRVFHKETQAAAPRGVGMCTHAHECRTDGPCNGFPRSGRR